METQTPQQNSGQRAAQRAEQRDQQVTVVSASSHKDTALLVFSVALVIGGLWAFYHFNPDFNVLIRTVMLLGALVGAAVAAYATAAGKELAGYVTGAYRIELRKVVWPSRQESVQATLMIAVIVIIFALVLAGVDWVLNYGVRALTGRGA